MDLPFTPAPDSHRLRSMYYIRMLLPSVLLIIFGLVAAAGIILLFMKDKKQFKLLVAIPQGIVGAICGLWGAYGLLMSLVRIGGIMHGIIFWLLMFFGSGLLFLMGISLVGGTIMTIMQNSAKPEMAEKLTKFLKIAYIADAILGVLVIFYALVRIIPNMFPELFFNY